MYYTYIIYTCVYIYVCIYILERGSCSRFLSSTFLAIASDLLNILHHCDIYNICRSVYKSSSYITSYVANTYVHSKSSAFN